MYVLLTGELGVTRKGELLATITSPLSVVGEMSALTGGPRAASVQALRKTAVIIVDDTQKMFEEYPQLGFKLARTLADRLGHMNTRYREIREAGA